MSSAFDSPDTVQLKGKVTGVTRLSRRAKVFVLVGISILMGFILFSIMSMDNGTTPIAPSSDQDQDQDKKGPVVEPAKPSFGNVGYGQAGVVAAASAAAAGQSLSPSYPTQSSDAAVGVSGVAVPAVPNTSGYKPPNHGGTGSQPAVNLGGGQNMGPHGEQYQTPEEAAAAKAMTS